MFSSKTSSHKGKTSKTSKLLSRRQRRKQERAVKKQKKVNYFQKQTQEPPQPSIPSTISSQSSQSKPPRISSQSKQPPLKQPDRTKQSDLTKKSDLTKLHRKRALEISNKREDAEISRLEKLLKIKKRKKLPTSFRDEGLDYILDLTEKSDQFDWGTLSSSSDHDGSDSEPEELSHPRKKTTSSSKDLPSSAGKTEQKTVKFDIPNESESEGSEFNKEGESAEKSGDEDFDEWCGSDGSEDNSEAGEECETDEECDGSEDGGEKWVPPHMRLKAVDKEKMARLQKQVQGLINRLSESNLRSITGQLEQLYREQSRNDVSSALGEVILGLCASAIRLNNRFAMEHALCLAILHSNVGQEIGASVVQKLAQRLDMLLRDSPLTHSTLECSCVLMIIAFLYNYRVVHCGLIYDIIRRLLEDLSERNIELLLILLKHTGMEIRRDDASSLKDIILLIQQKAGSMDSELGQSSRVKFMLETISALKTNNARKIPNYDPTLLEHMKRLLRGSIKSNCSLDEGQLKISLNDLLQADTRGRWWVVGSAWSGRDPAPLSAMPTLPQTQSESWVLELARQQRMTTDVRKTVFSVIMTSEDYADAFEKLMKLGLKEVQEREIVHVLINCCLQEKTFNPYYAFLGQKLCEFKHSHQVTFQYSLWDRFKVLESLTKHNRANLVKLLSHLISSKALSIAVLRVVEFVELGPVGVKFYKSLLTSLLCEPTEDKLVAIFTRVTPLPHLKALRDKLLIFLKHYLGSKKSSSELLSKRLEIVEKIMRTDSHLF